MGMKKTYSGFIAIIGPTNAGKSTLLNQIMGRKVSIVSHKVQTTRTRLRAIKMVGDKQLIFVDTPGVFKPSRRLDRQGDGFCGYVCHGRSGRCFVIG